MYQHLKLSKHYNMNVLKILFSNYLTSWRIQQLNFSSKSELVLNS